MVLVSERTEQIPQRDAGVPSAEDDGPTIIKPTSDPVSGGPAGPQPGEEAEALGAWGPTAQEADVVKDGEPGSSVRVQTI